MLSRARAACIYALVSTSAVRSDYLANGCHPSAEPAQCREYGYPIANTWQPDNDCCACQGDVAVDGDVGGCAIGYQFAAGYTNGECYSAAASGSCQVQTSCCIPLVTAERQYHRSPNTVASYAAAVEYCGANGGQLFGLGLAKIDSAADNERALAACGNNACWLAFQDLQLSGQWRWTEAGSPQFPSFALYTNWNAQYRQPGMNDVGGEYEPYAMLNSPDANVYDGTWFDYPDGNFGYALCNGAHGLPTPGMSASPPPAAAGTASAGSNSVEVALTAYGSGTCTGAFGVATQNFPLSPDPTASENGCRQVTAAMAQAAGEAWRAGQWLGFHGTRCAGHSDASYLCYADTVETCEFFIASRVTTSGSESGAGEGCMNFDMYTCNGPYYARLVDTDDTDDGHGTVTSYASRDCTGTSADFDYTVNSGCQSMPYDYSAIVGAPSGYFVGVYDRGGNDDWSIWTCAFNNQIECEGYVACKAGALVPTTTTSGACWPTTVSDTCTAATGAAVASGAVWSYIATYIRSNVRGRGGSGDGGGGSGGGGGGSNAGLIAVIVILGVLLAVGGAIGAMIVLDRKRIARSMTRPARPMMNEVTVSTATAPMEYVAPSQVALATDGTNAPLQVSQASIA